MAELTMQDVLNYIDQMTVLQLHEMTEALKEKYGVTAAAPMMMGPAAAGPEARRRKNRLSLPSFCLAQEIRKFK
jgi:large subunit ribosomal protein L7/L12